MCRVQRTSAPSVLPQIRGVREGGRLKGLVPQPRAEAQEEVTGTWLHIEKVSLARHSPFILTQRALATQRAETCADPCRGADGRGRWEVGGIGVTGKLGSD